MSGLSPSRYFPPAELAAEEGLLSVGGELTPEWLLDAYAHGIFPWPLFEAGEPMVWWSPDPRAIVQWESIHISRRLRRTCRAGAYRVTCNRAFESVIEGCATTDDRRGNTWLTRELMDAYIRLHQLGWAHSVEAWQDDELAGGVYGVALGGFFAAESKFHRRRDASKVALVQLMAHLKSRGYELLDIQQYTEHMASFGAIEIPRDAFLQRLAHALQLPVAFGDHLEGDVASL
ncbi:MAG: leucyl/phenylalanyl-tRNA--protein transferase [Pirellulales bacterium]